ncbi:MAG: hypothetical protein GY754_12430 [bacterium]|nr:hypothetical protein [bacterium]
MKYTCKILMCLFFFAALLLSESACSKKIQKETTKEEAAKEEAAKEDTTKKDTAKEDTTKKDTTASKNIEAAVTPEKTGTDKNGNKINDETKTTPSVVTKNKFAGTYSYIQTGFTGTLVIGIKDNAYYGTLKFNNWGKGIPQPLKEFRITESKIYFVRSIRTQEELKKYGGTRTFTQQYYGAFTPDGLKISGYYLYSGSETKWKAKRK